MKLLLFIFATAAFMAAAIVLVSQAVAQDSKLFLTVFVISFVIQFVRSRINRARNRKVPR